MSKYSQSPETIYENQKVSNPDIEKELRDFLGKLPDTWQFIKIEKNNVRVKNYVGVIGSKNYNIEVLPKIWRNSQNQDLNYETSRTNFFILFSYALFKPPFFEPYLKLLKKKKIANLRDFTLMLFSNSLFDELKNGVYRSYVKESTTSKYLRGKLEVRKHIARPNKAIFDLQTYNFSADNKLNQMFEWSLEEFVRASHNSGLREQMLQMSGILKSEYVRSTNLKNLDYSFNRISDRFEIPYNYVRTLLENGAVVTGGNKKEMMFLYDMNEIYEKFLFNFINKNKSKIFGTNGIKAVYNKGRKNMIIEPSTNKAIFMTKPDIMLNISHKLKLILDAKNKENEGQLINGIEQNDLYQMNAYSNSYDADSILYYPSAKKEHTHISGPYRFYEKSKHNLWVSTLNLDFSDDGWKDKMIENLKADFDFVIDYLQKNSTYESV